ncbi:LysR family transcriptional regulator [Microbacterium saperdae]|uniref:DNA-binding transcriptional LysR family regulator n=1 Tax=Microbacterium saperdae TaxID=69368 RepID=A0A543BLW5_9MICO|nr:LysR family transcriptional regulator [Microbacterium saperdae]TQL85783.1 DNA-binding transcriptional LysR family regulator [Microbacterium saperdae]GGM53077.1 LysR family transcriptional regulator [Microbacterium saperdae]
MELHQLQILRELGALGSVTAVAEALRVTPSAVSQQLAALQRGIETPLTRRAGRTLVLTPAGEVLAAAGAEAIDAMAAARTALDDFEGAATGVVSISGFHSVGQVLFGALLRELQTLEHAPTVQLTDEDVAQSEFPALTARYDLVLAHRMEHSPSWPTQGVRSLTLVREPLDVAVASTHPLASRRSLTPDDVADEPWVTSRIGYSPDDVLRAITAVANRPVEVRHRINDYGAVSAVVAAGGVIGMLPRFTSRSIQDRDIVRLPLDGVSTHRMIDVLARPENLRRRSVRVVVDALQRVMTRLSEWVSCPCGR